MNKKELVQKIVEDHDTLTKKAVEKIVSSVFDEIVKSLEDNESVDLFGFGKFEISERSAREGINPATKEKIQISASRSVKFKPSKSLKDKVNQ